MKCFVSVLGLIGAAAAAPQFLADTPEVQEAKIAFAKAFNKAARGSAIALEQAGVQDTDPNGADYSPAAVPYVHVDIPAEPYVHDEPGYVYEGDIDEPVQPVAAPVTQASVPQQAPFQVPVQAPAPAFNPVQNTFNVPAQNAAPFNFNPYNQYNGVYSPQQLAFNPQQAAFAQQQLAFNPQQQLAFNPQQRLPFNPQQLAFNQQQLAFNPQQQQQLAFNPQQAAFPEQNRAAASGCFNWQGAPVACAK